MENKYQQISVQKLATSTVDNRYLLQCNGLYYETSYSVAELVLMLQKYSEEKECISSFVRQKKGRYTTEQIENVIEQYIHPILIKNRGEKKNKTFLYERELFPISLIDKFLMLFVYYSKAIHDNCYVNRIFGGYLFHDYYRKFVAIQQSRKCL